MAVEGDPEQAVEGGWSLCGVIDVAATLKLSKIGLADVLVPVLLPVAVVCRCCY